MGDDAGRSGGDFKKGPTPLPPIPHFGLFHLQGFSSPNPLNIQNRAQLTGSIDTEAAMWNITDLLRALQPHCEII